MIAQKDSPFSINETYNLNGRNLRIVRLVSDAGLTSWVYEGWLSDNERSEDVHVAVKVMKPLSFDKAALFFEKEGNTLSSINEHEEKVNQEQGLNLHIAPKYYDTSETKGVPYFVMEFISGKELLELLQERGGKLPEAQALSIVRQLFYGLDILHRGLGKTFDDLKYENLRWVEGGTPTSGQLRLIDFGTLGTFEREELDSLMQTGQAPQGVSRDILLAGAYFCHLVTGRMPAYAMSGRLKERAEPIINHATMSWGTRRLLLSLLHRNPEKRPVSAEQVFKQLSELVNFWELKLDPLLVVASKLLKKAEAEDNQNDAEKARAALDIAKLRKPDDKNIDQDITRAEKILALSDYIERGKSFLRTGFPDSARKVFEEGMQWVDAPGQARRWAYLARIGEQIAKDDFDKHLQAAIQMVEHINRSDWTHAIQRMNDLKPVLASDGLNMLYADVQLFQSISDAEEFSFVGRYGEAAGLYRNAIQLLEKLPDSEFIKREELGDLLYLAEEQDRLAETIGLSQNLWQKAEAAITEPNTDWDSLIQKVNFAVSLNPESTDQFDRLNHLVEQALQRSMFVEAQELAWTGLSKNGATPKLWRALSFSQKLLASEIALGQMQKNEFLAIAREMIPMAESNRVFRELLLLVCEKAADKALTIVDSAWLLELSEIVERLDSPYRGKPWREKSMRFRQERHAALEGVINMAINDLNVLFRLRAIDPAKTEEVLDKLFASDLAVHLRQKRAWLDEIEKQLSELDGYSFETDYRRAEIEAMHHRLSEAQQQSSEYSSGQSWSDATSSEASIQTIRSLYENLKEFRVWSSRAHTVSAGERILAEISEREQASLQELVRQCQTFLISHDTSNHEVQEILQEFKEVIGEFGTQGWRLVKQIADEHLDIVDNALNRAKNAFESGDTVQALIEMKASAYERDSLPEEWISFNKQVAKAELFQDWLRNLGQVNSENMSKIRQFAAFNLPAPYYIDVKRRLEEASNNTMQNMKSMLKKANTPEFHNLLRTLVEIELTVRTLLVKTVEG